MEEEGLANKRKDYTGQRFGKLVALEDAGYAEPIRGERVWRLICDCGSIIEKPMKHILDGSTSSCGCNKVLENKSRVIDEVGNRYGKVKVLSYNSAKSEKQKRAWWNCRCDCGVEFTADGSALRKGKQMSCGCSRVRSIGEDRVEELLRINNIEYKRGYRFPDCKDVRVLEFDFAILENGLPVRLIEYDGIHHFEANGGYSTPDNFAGIVRRDKIKNLYCDINNYPLVRIPYFKRDIFTIEDLFSTEYEQPREYQHKISSGKYYTPLSVAKHCIGLVDTLGLTFERIIEPCCGDGAFLSQLPIDAIGIDILPEVTDPYHQVITSDFFEYKTDYIPNSICIGNPDFKRANKGSVQFIKKAMELGDYAAFIQPISQLNQNRTMKDTELILSEDLGVVNFSGKKVKVCFNVYHKCKDGHKTDYSLPGVYSRHIFRQGKYQHPPEILDRDWDFRVAAWGRLRLLGADEYADNEIVFIVSPEMRDWVSKKLQECDYTAIAGYVTSPNLPVWRLNKWLKEQWILEQQNT